jgi:hypothetical protein
MKTKNSIYTLMPLAVLFSFTSCIKDDLDTWVSIEASKSVVTVDEPVTFKISGNAETYVVYTGDAGHDFAKSYLVVTEGKKIDQEEYVLTQANLDAWTLVLQPELTTLDDNNTDSPVTMANVDLPTILVELKKMVDTPYYFDTAAQNLNRIMPDFVKIKDCNEFITGVLPSKPAHFTNNSISLTPAGGFSTGVALNRNNLTYSYKFNNAGTYVVTLLGSKLSDKNYSGSGYIDDRTSSASEYDYRRNTATVTIEVKLKPTTP